MLKTIYIETLGAEILAYVRKFYFFSVAVILTFYTMKKVSVIAAAALALLSCKKEMENHITTPTVPYGYSTTSLLEYEYYTPDGDVETEIRDALVALEDDETLDYTNINRAVWLLETGINYLIPDYPLEYLDFESDSMFLSLTLNDEELVSESELRSIVTFLYTNIQTALNGTKSHIGTDIYVKDFESNQIILGARISYITGVTTNYTQTGQPVGTTTIDRVAGYEYECPYSAGNQTNAAWRVARDNALVALRSYWGPPIIQGSNPKYYTNVVRYSSYPRSYVTNFINDEHLLGRPSAAFYYHQFPVYAAICVTASEQNVYAQKIHDDVNLKLGKDRGVLELVVEAKHVAVSGQNLPNTFWTYRDLVLGLNAWYSTGSQNMLTLNYL